MTAVATDDTTPDAAPDEAAPAAAHRRRRWPLVLVLLLVAAGGTAAAIVARDAAPATADEPAAAPPATATVERRDLVLTEELTGTLGYGSSRDVLASLSGVVTSVAPAGTVVRSGEPLYSVDLEPVLLVTGSIPAFRELSTDSDDGPDIQQLEEALVAFGYGTELTVDTEFDSDTADAVEVLETAIGRADPDGVVELGDVVFLDRPVRVGEVQADVGAQVASGTTVLSVTGTDQVVSVDIEADRTDTLPIGTTVAVELPDGSATTGTVAAMSTEADTAEDSEDEEAEAADPTVPVTITLDDPAAAAAYDEGNVTVIVEESREDGGLAVPVEALLALAEGGYALEVVEGSDTRLIAVDPGTYADGWVGVTGDELEAGLEVVVP